jgi:hypothetical protein
MVKCATSILSSVFIKYDFSQISGRNTNQIKSEGKLSQGTKIAGVRADEKTTLHHIN